MNRNAKLYFRYGTMGSAKTALLLTTAYNFEERGLKYLCMKPIVDTRDDRNVIRRESVSSANAPGFRPTPTSI